jgi:hypothetical protein
MKIFLKDVPVVFLSYDEPNCEENYQHLLSIMPNSLRVHGVKGSDTAHKKVADLVTSTHVTIIDADNIVNRNFFEQEVLLQKNNVLSFSGKNTVNNTQYGNGGVKVWPVDLLKTMKTHEISTDPKNLVDFDLEHYTQLNTVGSTVVINKTPLQAWRAGFREGVKLMTDNGMYKSLNDIDWRNFYRLWSWMHVGSDIENGLWCIHGSRYGCLSALNNYELHKLHDFSNIDSIFHSINTSALKENLLTEINSLGKQIRDMTNSRLITDALSIDNSKEYKKTVKPILRAPDNKRYDIVFISYNEINADENYNNLLKRFPRAKRVHGIKGIHNAHIEAAKKCDTDYFWVVDGDSEIVDEFNFTHEVPFFEQPKVRVWRAKNPINGLIYGYGGVKLLPRLPTIHMRLDRPDMTTSISTQYEPIMVVSNITKFNTDPFNTWRSSFRECAKLASEVIDGQISNETKHRLDVWTSEGLESEFGSYAIDGAKLGKEYGIKHKNDLISLRKINDFEWLKELYDRFY